MRPLGVIIPLDSFFSSYLRYDFLEPLLDVQMDKLVDLEASEYYGGCESCEDRTDLL